MELAVALVVGHELEDGDEEVGEDERRHRLAVAAEAKHDGNSLMVTWTQKYKKFTGVPSGPFACIKQDNILKVARLK